MWIPAIAVVGMAAGLLPGVAQQRASVEAIELARLAQQIDALETLLQKRLDAIESHVSTVTASLGQMEGDAEWVAASFLANPPQSSDLVGMAGTPVFAPQLDVDSPARHDIVFLSIMRLDAEGANLVGRAELTEAVGATALPLDRNGALYVAQWTTSEGHDYDLILRDGLSGRVAATVKVGPYERTGSFVFVGYGVGLEVPLRSRR
jgi:hypothetical protein